MKYLKKFENTLVPTLLNCFDELAVDNPEFDVTQIHILISIKPKLPEFFELGEDMKNDIISSIGKAVEIGYKFERVRMYNGIVSDLSYYSLGSFDDFKNIMNYDKRSNFRFDHLTQIIIFFR